MCVDIRYVKTEREREREETQVCSGCMIVHVLTSIADMASPICVLWQLLINMMVLSSRCILKNVLRRLMEADLFSISLLLISHV